MVNLHPPTVHFPIAFLSFGTLADLVGLWRPEVVAAASTLILLGVACAALTVTAGLLDYRNLADDPVVVRIADRHLVLAVTACSCYCLSLVARLEEGSFIAPGPLALGLSILGLGFLVVTGHMGGQLVYRYNVGRAPGEPGLGRKESLL